MVGQNKKTKSKENKLEFVGWGSKLLIEFLDSIGKESRRYSPAEVEAIVKNYATSNELNSKNKKTIFCDEKLVKVFSKHRITRRRVHKFLKVHLVENHNDEGSSEEEEDKVCSLEKKDVQCFAALIPQNIRLIYLKRTLVLNLLNNNPESFEKKVVGSIVRVSSELSNITIKKHRFQLQQVTDLVRSSGLFLRLSNVVADVPISQLHDGNFTEEECEEFQEQVKDGWIKRPSFEEFEFKANFLHRDITLHSIDKEIKWLQACMDHANEKGLGREFFEYSDRIQTLSKREEQENRLAKMPVLVASSAEETEHNETPIAEEEEEEKVEDQEPKETLVGDSAKVEEEMEERAKFANYERWVYETASEMSGRGFQTCIGVDPDAAIWRGANRKGFIEGPTSLIQLWMSYQLGYLDPDFRVWKIGQSQGKSVLLFDLLNKLSSQ